MNVISRHLSAAAAGMMIVAAGVVPAGASAPSGRYTYTASSATVYDTKTKLTWQHAPMNTAMSQDAAKSYCASASTATALGGTGWRLPTIKELMTLVDFSRSGGYGYDSDVFPGLSPNYYWSSTPVVGMPSTWWAVNFYFGATLMGPGRDSAVVCVR